MLAWLLEPAEWNPGLLPPLWEGGKLCSTGFAALDGLDGVRDSEAVNLALESVAGRERMTVNELHLAPPVVVASVERMLREPEQH